MQGVVLSASHSPTCSGHVTHLMPTRSLEVSFILSALWAKPHASWRHVHATEASSFQFS